MRRPLTQSLLGWGLDCPDTTTDTGMCVRVCVCICSFTSHTHTHPPACQAFTLHRCP